MSNHYLIIPEVGDIFYTADLGNHKDQFIEGIFCGIAEIIDITNPSTPLRLSAVHCDERWEEIER
jgi:hypothetical protein